MPVFSTTKSTNLVSALQLISHRRQNKSNLRIQQHNIDKERKGKMWCTKTNCMSDVEAWWYNRLRKKEPFLVPYVQDACVIVRLVKVLFLVQVNIQSMDVKSSEQRRGTSQCIVVHQESATYSSSCRHWFILHSSTGKTNGWPVPLYLYFR